MTRKRPIMPDCFNQSLLSIRFIEMLEDICFRHWLNLAILPFLLAQENNVH